MSPPDAGKIAASFAVLSLCSKAVREKRRHCNFIAPLLPLYLHNSKSKLDKSVCVCV